MKSKFGRYLKREFFDPIIDVFFPPICYICDRYLPHDRKIICEQCWSEIPEFDGKLDQSLRIRSFDNLFILFEFEEKIRQLIHLLKYKQHLTLCRYFASEAKLIIPNLNNQTYNEIIPVPLYKTRRRERGYNQSEEIANAMAKIYNIPVKNEHLLRIRATSSQTKMTKEEREKNVRNAFHCPVNLDGNHILLVDDVITTGSTIEVCVNILKKAGADIVDVFTIAHPSPKFKRTHEQSPHF
jgi:ComF family protein